MLNARIIITNEHDSDAWIRNNSLYLYINHSMSNIIHDHVLLYMTEILLTLTYKLYCTKYQHVKVPVYWAITESSQCLSLS